MAAYFGNVETVKYLLGQGADINARSKDDNLNNTALHAAIAGNNEYVVELLIHNGANINIACNGQWRLGFTPLHVAGYFGRESMIRILLQAGADKAAITDNGQTAYDLAIMRGHTELAVHLK